MADQLRWDRLGCAGHPYLETPHIDTLARCGLRCANAFANAFANSGVCGPSRMSFYTGRRPITHGAAWNRVPLSVGELLRGGFEQIDRYDSHHAPGAGSGCPAFLRNDCIRTVRAACQGLLAPLHHPLGRLFDLLAACGVPDDTFVVFTADHGGFLGDHWLGEKTLFYDNVLPPRPAGAGQARAPVPRLQPAP